MTSGEQDDGVGGGDTISALSALTSRIKAAVKAGGGNNTVASASGIPISTLNGYIAGREPKALAIAAIAKTCDVSIDWLLLGEGEMRPAAGIAFGPVMSLQDGGLLPYEPPKLFQIVKMDALAAAMEGAFKATDTLPRDFAAWRARAQISCLIYDDIMSRSHGDEQKPSPKQE